MEHYEQEASGIYFVLTKWNYYLQGSEIVVCNDHKPLQKFLNGTNANNKVNRWSLTLATYNITFEWISGAHTKQLTASHVKLMSRTLQQPTQLLFTFDPIDFSL